MNPPPNTRRCLVHRRVWKQVPVTPPKFAGHVKSVPDNQPLYEANFHAFSPEGDSGEMYAAAIVEKDDGTVETVAADLIKFLDR